MVKIFNTLLFILVLYTLLYWAHHLGVKAAEETISMKNSYMISLKSVKVDPETGCMDIVTETTRYPRLDSDGNHMCVDRNK